MPLGSYEVGRDVGRIVLHDPRASTSHARIEVHPRGVTITDMGSTNGTFDSQGQRLMGPTEMAIDRTFRLGDSSITLTRVLPSSGGTILASSRTVLASPSPSPWVATPASPFNPTAVASVGHPMAPVPPTDAGQGYAPGSGGSRPMPSRSSDWGSLLGPGLVGGIVGGVLSSIPFFGLLNTCFCLLNVIGCQVGLAVYFSQHPTGKLRGKDAAVLGAISGATTGLLTSFLQIVGFSMLTMGIPGLSISLSMVAIVFVSFALYTGFGVLGAVICLSLFYGSRKAT
ncbi:MAG: FHA domain-containing protein [Myxococcales bacterium]|nr:FHA domain-containing protein [Myxococcales bacterium]